MSTVKWRRREARIAALRREIQALAAEQYDDPVWLPGIVEEDILPDVRAYLDVDGGPREAVADFGGLAGAVRAAVKRHDVEGVVRLLCTGVTPEIARVMDIEHETRHHRGGRLPHEVVR